MSNSTYDSLILSDPRPPQAYYRLTELSGAQASDSSGNGYTATLSGVTAYGQPGAILGDSDTSLLFGAGGRLTLPPALNPMSWSALSCDFWCTVAGGGWEYVAVTTDGSNTFLFLDGLPIPSIAGQALLISSLFHWMGSGMQSTGFAKVGVYNYQLSQAQITRRCLVGGGGTALPLSVASVPGTGVSGAAEGELPLFFATSSYAVSGVALPDQPYICTAPLSATSGNIPVGSVIFLMFNSPSATTQALLATGNTLFLTFGIALGKMVTGQVQVTSSILTGPTFQVFCTTLAPILLSN